MSYKGKHPIGKRYKALLLHSKGLGARKISKLLKVSKATVSYWFNPEKGKQRVLRYRSNHKKEWLIYKKKYDAENYKKHREKFLLQRAKYKLKIKRQASKELALLKTKHRRILRKFKERYGL